LGRHRLQDLVRKIGRIAVFFERRFGQDLQSSAGAFSLMYTNGHVAAQLFEQLMGDQFALASEIGSSLPGIKPRAIPFKNMAGGAFHLPDVVVAKWKPQFQRPE
jgi:hypothetical protein